MLKRRKKAPEGDPVLVKVHPLAIRWFHWINFPVLAIMVWSGILIFFASHKSGKITVFGHQIPDRLFAPGIPKWVPNWVLHPWHWDPKWTPFAPAIDGDTSENYMAFYNFKARLAEGMGWHLTFMWFFALNGLAYVLYLVISKEYRTVVPKLSSFKNAVLVALAR